MISAVAAVLGIAKKEHTPTLSRTLLQQMFFADCQSSDTLVAYLTAKTGAAPFLLAALITAIISKV
jgi:hypothetical protein